MISRTSLEEYAKTRGLRNIGHAEVDYFQNIVLFILSQEYGSTLVFKGGTALSKCYGLPRFSEDLDFNAKEKINELLLVNALKRFQIEHEIEKDEYKDGLKYTIHVNGPLFIGAKNSRCRIILDLSLREKTLLEPEIKTIGRFLEEVPLFDILVMQKEEIFAEKIRAIMTRNKARDLYDLWFLMKERNYFNEKLTTEKLNFYKKQWNKKDFINSITEKKPIWEKELSPLIDNIPEFKIIKEEVLSNL